MKKYESLFIIAPESAGARLEQVKNDIAKEIERGNGTIDSVNELGLKTMSYAIKGNHEGFYYEVFFTTETSAIQEMRNRINLNQDILRYLIVAEDK